VPSPRAISTLAVLALAVAVPGCGGEDDPAKRTEGGQAPQAGEQNGPEESRQAKARRLARDRQDQEREREQLEKEEREFDEAFKKSSFDKLLEKLPIRAPPLYVEQYITTENSHKVYTAVDPKRFLCKLTPREREKAVAGFYRSANEVFRGGGVEDFVQVVTPTAETTEKLPALATAGKGSVSLTKRGRGRGPC